MELKKRYDLFVCINDNERIYNDVLSDVDMSEIDTYIDMNNLDSCDYRIEQSYASICEQEQQNQQELKLAIATQQATAQNFEQYIKKSGLDGFILPLIIAYYKNDYKQEVEQLIKEMRL